MKHLLIILFAMVSFPLAAQRQAGNPEVMIEEICNAASEIHSLQCKFRQTKNLSLLATEMVSTGRMYYKEGMLRWEYLSPYRYIFIINGERVLLDSPSGSNVIDTKTNKMFGSIANIMMSSLTGNIIDTEEFDTLMLEEKEGWIAELTPVKKEMQQFFTKVRLHINPVEKSVEKVELLERGGDTTLIEMTEIEKNVSVDDSVFEILH